MSREIFAHHAHLHPKDERPHGSTDDLFRTLDACNIARCVAFAPMPHRTQLASPNDWLAEEIAKSKGRLEGFGVIDVRRDDIEQQVQHIPELNLRGIKLHPASQQFHLMEDKAKRIYAEAEKLHLPISFHTGVHYYRISCYNMLLYDEVAFLYPHLKFCMEHIGGYSFFKEGVAVMVNNSRKTMPYAGMTSVSDRGKEKHWYLTDEQINELRWMTGDDHMIFGLDFPYHTAAHLKETILRFERMDWPEETKDKLFGGNLKVFLGME